jgi:hypothetical protein
LQAKIGGAPKNFLKLVREVSDGYTGHHKKTKVIQMRKPDGTKRKALKHSKIISRRTCT